MVAEIRWIDGERPGKTAERFMDPAPWKERNQALIVIAGQFSTWRSTPRQLEYLRYPGIPT
jgi:hypothetical protein